MASSTRSRCDRFTRTHTRAGSRRGRHRLPPLYRRRRAMAAARSHRRVAEHLEPRLAADVDDEAEAEADLADGLIHQLLRRVWKRLRLLHRLDRAIIQEVPARAPPE